MAEAEEARKATAAEEARTATAAEEARTATAAEEARKAAADEAACKATAAEKARKVEEARKVAEAEEPCALHCIHLASYCMHRLRCIMYHTAFVTSSCIHHTSDISLAHSSIHIVPCVSCIVRPQQAHRRQQQRKLQQRTH